MDDDIAIISDDEESDHDEKAAVQDKIVEMEKKLSESTKPKAKGFSLPISEVTDAWMDDDIAAIESEEEEEGLKEEYDDDDLETQMLLNKKVPQESPKAVKEGRLSALEMAQKFSCDEEDLDLDMEEITIIDEVKISQEDESTSWAFVAAKESHKKGETASAETRVDTSEHAPALVVEIIEKEKKVETIDKEGYKVVKGKNKVKKTSAEVNEKLGTVDLIKELDQPLEPVSSEPKPVETKKSTGINLPVVEMTDDWMDDAVVMGSMDSDEEEDAALPKISLPEEQAKPAHTQQDLTKDSRPDNEEINDPWLAVKPEYKRKDSTSSEKESDARDEGGYTIQVKVTTKETCLGRRLHENETSDQDWKMDVTCTQKGQIPNIVEGHEAPVIEQREKRRSKSGFDQIEEDRKYHSLPRQKTSAEGSQGLVPPLSPSWMRKDLSRSTTSIDSNQSMESGLTKERKTSDSISSIVTSSCETLDDPDDDVYWRLKNKVKKKKRKNRTSQETEKSPERKVPSITEPIIEETSTTTQSALNIVTSSFSRVEKNTTEKVVEMKVTTENIHPHATQSIQGTTRKISTSRTDVPSERTTSLENEDFSKEATSTRQIDRTSNIAIPVEEVAQNDMTNDAQKKTTITPSITLDEHASSATSAPVEIKMDPPDIVLSESRMEQATELLRACSPRDNSDEKEPEINRRPTFMRQNSKEMQSAVDMPRGGPSPVSFEKQRHLSVSGQPEPWQDDGDDNGTNYSEEDKQVSGWSAITSKVSAPKKSGKRSRKSSKSKQAEGGVDDANENGDSEKKGNPTVQRTSFASLSTDSLTDAWENDESGKINGEEEEDEELKNLTQVQKPLALPQPSYARVASHEAINTLDDPPLPAASEVVALKPASTLPMVINVEETQETAESFVDEEGFEQVASRKAKRERKISKRYSQVSDDMEHEAADNGTTRKGKEGEKN